MVYDAVVVGGGLASTFWHQCFAFDAGIRAFENSGILFPMLKSLGIQLDCTRNPVSIDIANQWTRLRLRESRQDYSKIFGSHAP